MEKDSIEQVFGKFAELNVLVFGDAMVDSYLWGKVDRISPEAPVPIVTVTKQENRLGEREMYHSTFRRLAQHQFLYQLLEMMKKAEPFLN